MRSPAIRAAQVPSVASEARALHARNSGQPRRRLRAHRPRWAREPPHGFSIRCGTSRRRSLGSQKEAFCDRPATAPGLRRRGRGTITAGKDRRGCLIGKRPAARQETRAARSVKGLIAQATVAFMVCWRSGDPRTGGRTGIVRESAEQSSAVSTLIRGGGSGERRYSLTVGKSPSRWGCLRA